MKKWKELQKKIALDLGIRNYYIRKGLKEPDIETENLVVEVKTGKNFSLEKALEQAQKYCKDNNKITIAVGRQYRRQHIDACLSLSQLVELYLKAKKQNQEVDFTVYVMWEDLKQLLRKEERIKQ